MPNYPITSLDFPKDGIAVITLDDPAKGANLLSQSTLEELERHFDALDQLDDVVGLVIRSTKPGNFIAGANLAEFVQSLDAPKQDVIALCHRGQQLFGRLSQCNYVTVAAIDGICVGGGAELACWCDRRIMTRDDATSFGFPEVKLGIIPGWGGTARMPRMVGLSNAVELITGGESISADEAYKMNLAQEVLDVPAADEANVVDAESRESLLLDAANRLITTEQDTQQYLRDREKWSAPIEIGETELGFLGVTANAYIQQQTKGHYPAPLAALEVMLEAASVDVQAACEIEAGAFSELFGSNINRALINIFFLRDRNKKDRGVDGDAHVRDVKSVSVVGSGIMGQGIAAANVKRHIPVTITDANEQALAAGVRGVLEEVSYNKQTKQADVDRALEFSPLVNATVSDSEVASSDLVVEAIVEKIDAKKQLFARLEPQLADGAILCSNTSTIPITKMAEGLQHPERFCGLHFFNPVRRMPLVEVICTEKTSDQVVATAVTYAKRLGKSPIVVKDGPGFLVNRLLLPYMNEALELLCEGASIKQVEKAAKSFGMPMGPLTLYDVVGIDTALNAGRVMQQAFPDRIVENPTLAALYDTGRLGQKSGSGFFSYQNKKGKGTDDPAVEELLKSHLRGTKDFSNNDLQDRMFLPMVVEATRILEEGLVRDARDVDLGLIMGIGFPPFKGGLLFWTDTVGTKKIVDRLEKLTNLGRRYEPTKMLTDMAATGGKFYDESGKNDAK